jgi:acetylglutamate kinase
MADTQTTSPSTRNDWLSKAGVLTEALPFMRRYSGHRIVVKFGGHAMSDADALRSFADDMSLLSQVGARPVVVHGGGPQIGEMLKKLNIQSEFIDGLRVTDKDTVSIVEMVLSGAINKALAAAIQDAGGHGVGVSGKDDGLIIAEKITKIKGGSNIEDAVDLGFVGAPKEINTHLLDALIDAGTTPVVAPVASDGNGETYNINADTAAGAISAALGATRLLMLTDVSGVLNKDGDHIQKLNIKQARALIKDGTIVGGMIPKVETCIDAVEGGADAAVILDGRETHAVLVELFTEHGIGTIITKD